jgi:3-hydroxybutyryl-CoA dehydrogenase
MAAAQMVIGVIGAGAMGGGIAQVAAAAGHTVILGDAMFDAVARARAGIASALARDVAKGRLTQPDADAITSRIGDAGDLEDGYAAFASCGLVIEAIAERLEAKMALLKALERSVADDCVLGTNTSSLPVAAIAGACRVPERVIGIHFFNPAPLMPLVEIVPSLSTSADVAPRVRSLVEHWKKVPVIARDTPGFIVNRIARPFYGEPIRMLEEGIADVSTIDWAMREIGGFRMGPFELMDFIGHDVNFAVTQSVFAGLFHDPRYRPSVTQQRLVQAGHLGRKAKRGFYDYRDGATPPEPQRDRALGEQIVDRVLAMLVNEAVEAVHLRVASAADIELSMTRGVNYPRGLLAWGDAIGPAAVLKTLDVLHAEYGDDRYRASVLLRRRVAMNEALLA